MSLAWASGVDVQRFRPVVPWTARVAVRGAPRFLERQSSLSLTGSYAFRPLDFGHRSVDRVGGVVDHLAGGELVAGTLVSRKVSIGLHVPLYYTQGPVPVGVGKALGGSGGLGLGDIGASAFVLPAPGLALGVSARVPTGTRRAFLGGTGVSLGADASAETRAGRTTVAGDLGVIVRTGAVEQVGLLAGHEVTMGVSTGVELGSARAWTVGSEVVGATVIQRAFLLSHTPVEAFGTVGFDPGGPLRLGLGAGPGLTPGFGAPVWRAFARLVWQNSRPPRRVTSTRGATPSRLGWPDRLRAKGLGADRPVDSSHTAASHQKNRRVQFIVVESDPQKNRRR